MSAVAINLRGWPVAALPAGEIRQGRALSVLNVLRQPRPTAAVVGQHWPDSMLPIRRAVGEYFEIPGGYVPQTDLQPMVITSAALLPESAVLPFWAEVRGAVSAVRAYAAADAPLRARIGHGGVLQVVERLPGEPMWYGLADASGERLGWAQASAWSPVVTQTARTGAALLLDTRRYQWRLEQDGQVLGGGMFAGGRALVRGQYRVEQRTPASTEGAYAGAAWRLTFGAGASLVGAYWHNRFGQGGATETVQLPPAQACWCYECLGQDGTIIIE